MLSDRELATRITVDELVYRTLSPTSPENVHGADDAVLEHARACAAAWSPRRWVPTWAIEAFPNAGWDWAELSSNVSAISLEFILKTRDSLPWCWYDVSGRDDVTREIVSFAPEAPWNASVLRDRGLIPRARGEARRDGALARGVSPREIVDRIDRDAAAGRVDIDRVRRHIDLPLDFQTLSKFPELNDLIIERPDRPWDWTRVSIYADADRFLQRPDLFDARYLVVPHVSARAVERVAAARVIVSAFRRRRARRVEAATVIQHAWRAARLDPSFMICRTHLARTGAMWGLVGHKRRHEHR